MPNIRYFFKINQSDHSFDEDVRIKVSVDGNVVLEDFTVTNKKPKTITVTANNINPGKHEVRLDLLNPKSSNTIDGEETSRYLIVHNVYYDTQITDWSETHLTVNKNCGCCSNDEERFQTHSKIRCKNLNTVDIDTGWPIVNSNFGYLQLHNNNVSNSNITINTRELFTERTKLTSLQFDDIDMLEKWPFGPENIELTSLVFTYIHPTDQNHKMVYREGVANKKEQEMIRNPGEYDSETRAMVHKRTLRSNMVVDDVRDPAQKCLDTRDDSTEDPIIHETNLIFLDK